MPENISFAMLDKEDLDEFSDYLNEEALALSGRADTFFYGAFQEEDELAAVLSVEVRSDEDQIRILSIAVTPALQHTVMVWKLPLRGEITESAEEKAKEKPVESESRFTDDGFRLLTNAELKCRDCIYRLKEEGVLECHKYSTKPAEIIAGGNCACYRA